MSVIRPRYGRADHRMNLKVELLFLEGGGRRRCQDGRAEEGSKARTDLQDSGRRPEWEGWKRDLGPRVASDGPADRVQCATPARRAHVAGCAQRELGTAASKAHAGCELPFDRLEREGAITSGK
jgi:hypothetical protein